MSLTLSGVFPETIPTLAFPTISKRLDQHNKGYNRTTKPYRPFKSVYLKEFDSRLEARQHEKYLKTSKGRDFIKTLE